MQFRAIVAVKYPSGRDSIYRFEACKDIIIDSLLRDICKHVTENNAPSIEEIYIQQHFEVVKFFKNILSKPHLVTRLKDYSPLLGNEERERKIKKENNSLLLKL